jgi:hypothetical protein
MWTLARDSTAGPPPPRAAPLDPPPWPLGPLMAATHGEWRAARSVAANVVAAVAHAAARTAFVAAGCEPCRSTDAALWARGGERGGECGGERATGERAVGERAVGEGGDVCDGEYTGSASSHGASARWGVDAAAGATSDAVVVAARAAGVTGVLRTPGLLLPGRAAASRDCTRGRYDRLGGAQLPCPGRIMQAEAGRREPACH